MLIAERFPTREQPEGPTNDRRDERPTDRRFADSLPYGGREKHPGNIGPTDNDFRFIRAQRPQVRCTAP
jgi:hypothetical protein